MEVSNTRGGEDGYSGECTYEAVIIALEYSVEHADECELEGVLVKADRLPGAGVVRSSMLVCAVRAGGFRWYKMSVL